MKPDLYASRFHGYDGQRVKNQQAIEMFINHGGFLRPFRVILDSCLFEEKGFTQEMVRVLLQDPEARFYVTGCIQSEICTRNKFKGNKIPSIELDEIQLLRCNHELNTFDTNCIKKLLENYNPQKFVVVTSRPDFAQEIDNNLQCIVVFYRNSNVYLKPVSVFVKSVHHQILHDDYKRLKMRMQLFNLVESSVGIGGNTFFESLSQQLNRGSHQAIRTQISVQLDSFPDLYTAKVNGQYDTFVENVIELLKRSWATYLWASLLSPLS